MAHPNEDLVRGGYEAFMQGDFDGALSRFADDILWSIPGRGPIAGDYHGPQEVMGFFGQLMELSGGTFRLELHDVVGDDDHVVALVKGTAERDGRRLDSDAAHVWHVKDGKATEFWGLTTSPYEDDEFWM